MPISLRYKYICFTYYYAIHSTKKVDIYFMRGKVTLLNGKAPTKIGEGFVFYLTFTLNKNLIDKNILYL